MTDPDVLQALLETMETPGWETVAATARKRRDDAATRLLQVTTLEDLKATQAEIRTLDWLLGLPDETARQYQQATKRAPQGAEEGG